MAKTLGVLPEQDIFRSDYMLFYSYYEKLLAFIRADFV